MTESEAIELLKKANRDNDIVCILPKSDMGKCLIKALEEIQQYRAIGTVEECRAAVEIKRISCESEEMDTAEYGKEHPEWAEKIKQLAYKK